MAIDPSPNVSALCPVTLIQVKDFLGIDHHNVSKDGLLVGSVENATLLFEMETARVIVARTLTQRFRGDGGMSKFRLNRIPIISVTSVTVGGSIVDPTLYEVGPGGMLCFSYCPARSTLTNIVVVYRAGWEVGSVPLDIVDAILRLVKKMYDEIPSGVISIVPPGMALSVSKEWPIRTELPPTVGMAVKRWTDLRH